MRVFTCCLVLVLFGAAGASVAQGLAHPATSDTSAAAVAAKLRAYVQAQVQKGFGGSVLVARSNQVLLQEEAGPAMPGAAPLRAYWLGSTTKQFTAAAILKLAEQGRLQPSNALTKFFPAPPDKQSITLHQLLTHTSGLGNLYSADGMQQREPAVQAILAKPLAAPVGAGYRYSSDGYALLAAVVEVASGMPYEQYLRTSLLAPAGMLQTGFWGEEAAHPGLLASVQDARRTRSARATVYKKGRAQANYGYRGATGMYSTTADFFRWLQALHQGRVLSESSRQQLFAPAVPVRKEGANQVSYGYGWVVVTREGQLQEVRHTGAEDWLGHNSFVVMAGDLTIVVLSNAGEPNGNAWSRTVAEGLQRQLQKP
jgi:CubicO group peptidase (beta-lactamase class C family)